MQEVIFSCNFIVETTNNHLTVKTAFQAKKNIQISILMLQISLYYQTQHINEVVNRENSRKRADVFIAKKKTGSEHAQ